MLTSIVSLVLLVEKSKQRLVGFIQVLPYELHLHRQFQMRQLVAGIMKMMRSIMEQESSLNFKNPFVSSVHCPPWDYLFLLVYTSLTHNC